MVISAQCTSSKDKKYNNFLKRAQTTSGAAILFCLVAMQRSVSDSKSAPNTVTKRHKALFGNVPLHSSSYATYLEHWLRRAPPFCFVWLLCNVLFQTASQLRTQLWSAKKLFLVTYRCIAKRYKALCNARVMQLIPSNARVMQLIPALDTSTSSKKDFFYYYYFRTSVVWG